MLQGYANYMTHKLILGWLVDTIQGTITLCPHQYQCLMEIFDDLQMSNHIMVSKWHKILGKLQNMVLGIPGSKGLFSFLQSGFTYKEK